MRSGAAFCLIITASAIGCRPIELELDSHRADPPAVATPTQTSESGTAFNQRSGTAAQTKPLESNNSAASPTPSEGRPPRLGAPAISPIPPVSSERTAPAHERAETAPRVLNKYLLRPGDELEILYTQEHPGNADYRLLAGDKIHVEFLHLGPREGGGKDPDKAAAALDRSITIQPDGKGFLPYIGAVALAGKTVEQVTKELNDRYREWYLDPSVLVTLEDHGAALKDLRRATESAGSRLAQIAPDGLINLPHVGLAPAAGLTMSELQRELSERTRRLGTGMGITVRLSQHPPRRIGSGSPTAAPASGRDRAAPSASPVPTTSTRTPVHTIMPASAGAIRGPLLLGEQAP